MQRSTNRILRTPTGSLPRPDDLAQMVYDTTDGKPVNAKLATLARGAALASQQLFHLTTAAVA